MLCRVFAFSGENVCWQCESVGFYRNEPASEASFSEDGSLLAVAFAGVLTLWDPSTNQLRATLPHEGLTGKIRHLVFGSGTCSHMLLCVAEDVVLAWNLLTTAGKVFPFSYKSLRQYCILFHQNCITEIA